MYNRKNPMAYDIEGLAAEVDGILGGLGYGENVREDALVFLLARDNFTKHLFGNAHALEPMLHGLNAMQCTERLSDRIGSKRLQTVLSVAEQNLKEAP